MLVKVRGGQVASVIHLSVNINFVEVISKRPPHNL